MLSKTAAYLWYLKGVVIRMDQYAGIPAFIHQVIVENSD